MKAGSATTVAVTGTLASPAHAMPRGPSRRVTRRPRSRRAPSYVLSPMALNTIRRHQSVWMSSSSARSIGSRNGLLVGSAIP